MLTSFASNASFERICLSYWLQRHHPEHFKSYSIPEDSVRKYLNPESWRCSMVWSAYMGLPLSLEGAGAVLKLDDQKLSEGKDLIRYFCVPCAPTKANGGRTRNLPEHAPEKWSLFKKYNQRDVEVEMAIQQRLRRYCPWGLYRECRLEVCLRALQIVKHKHTSPRLHGNTGGQLFTGKCGGLCFQWIAHRITQRSQGIQTFASLGTCANDIFISLIKQHRLN